MLDTCSLTINDEPGVRDGCRLAENLTYSQPEGIPERWLFVLTAEIVLSKCPTSYWLKTKTACAEC